MNPTLENRLTNYNPRIQKDEEWNQISEILYNIRIPVRWSYKLKNTFLQTDQNFLQSIFDAGLVSDYEEKIFSFFANRTQNFYNNNPKFFTDLEMLQASISSQIFLMLDDRIPELRQKGYSESIQNTDFIKYLQNTDLIVLNNAEIEQFLQEEGFEVEKIGEPSYYGEPYIFSREVNKRHLHNTFTMSESEHYKKLGYHFRSACIGPGEWVRD